ncbi:mannose-1-phosphate guanylyltransferase/mannose-6-phosphate isomerase [Desulfurivibrio sp. C05AmB]|jgi:mannose-1-phosphate guanylyltransferase / mannose-6-phosphate isomerase|uniref:mannose-1-phosphate guanylyltransferase/mannose-6-phosphate isomerase n=1 Tax=Desulfurivibrio sp. C05AmB TaxID=3374371 RepID=UPI00376EE71D
MIVPVVLAGGAGTRLWPLSRELYPKQFLPLVGEMTMLQETLNRVGQLAGCGRPIVVCTEAHRFMVAEQLRAIGVEADIIIEPVGHDTAPAIAAAAHQAMAGGDDPLLLVLPSDHLVTRVDIFAVAVTAAVPLALAGCLVTFGIVPTRPETGYGYIQPGPPLTPGTPPLDPAQCPGNGTAAYAVTRFVEKPALAAAQAYLEQGYLWNSGMFLFRASELLDQLAHFEPEMAARIDESYEKRVMDLDFIRLEAESFAAAPGRSFDYAVMERTPKAAVVPLACGWSDVGSWNALWEIGSPDAQGNIFQGQVLARETRNCYAQGTGRLLALLGVEDLVVVETADAVLVARRDRVQEVRELVGSLKEQGRDEAMLHRRVFRPWGFYECVDTAERFQVKRIVVNPGASLSLQRHYHRAEHWVVVKGTAEVTTGSEVRLLGENESTFIPVGVSHRLRNPGQIPLEIIEVQSGSYLGEDDIERLEDLYGR